MNNPTNPPVSNLSSALRNINIQDNNNINSNNNDGNPNINILRQNAPGQVGNDMLLQRPPTNTNPSIIGNGDQGFNEPIVQHDILPSQNSGQINQNSNVDNSRLVNFFQNQPVSGYTLFSHRSAPNGFKVAIILSELNLSYNTFFLDFNAGEHRSPEFISITPNARVPALIDHGMDNLSVWESGAILLHLVNRYYKATGDAKLWSSDLAEQAQINGWLFFQATGHAPMIGQALHFRYFHSEKLPSALDRYTAEVRRVYAVIEMALAEKRESLIMELDIDNAASYSAGTTPLSQSRFFDYPIWLVCDRITIADLSFVPWNNVVDRIGINIKLEYPEVYKWTKHMMRRPAVIKALRCE
ncbi:similar to Saccharomyces cerevisiae YNL229C URE2 Nitrogen catabolite repression transcriptional regulator that acts by inhibition of GLN3 transcription in good nitrogen source [Maudiozyma barnettii]|uniref:Protein URE2 n=1 Tax=Maudiozyma barnettii TaxID=61262 RepID=A0A8H2VIN5_9SACH|nr:uncharacterized protein KABA2_07S08338 [Kazachstania barnettii]CAB4255959.1 similar to Saccharomyces cerevisiae YNL229C URE2 Nitrogen catabolite repression transcriptional regulator that acts by inhibition of GLN3 transcription in good nitrogen source [Kazachstania barnettii]CAD1784519.1 similar to Saccharomyces cerevisiae YNL229C URE2 Nitrogen catabolite repression transcriptional regulator that acts by inhibition of GLN3 transcription in good nitrogen source [Kazachstania barnettii]